MNRMLALTALLALAADAQAEDSREAFFAGLKALCGARFEGGMTFPKEGQDAFAGKRLVAEIRDCDATQIRVPFAVGEDRSRTWVFTRTAEGLQLQHDHRHADGRPDAKNLYGGMAKSDGTAHSQAFAADAYTAKLIPEAATNVWTVSLSADGQELSYHLERHGQPRFTAVLKRQAAR